MKRSLRSIHLEKIFYKSNSPENGNDLFEVSKGVEFNCEYSNAIVHAFQRFRAPFSGKIVHIFPEQSAVI